jgi:putative flippase GtrA
MSPARRPVVFTLVGLAGFALQAGALWLLAGRAGLGVVPATLLATELAVLHNFAWHVRWTWADRPAGASATAVRLLRFNLSNGGVSLAGGAVLMPVLVDGLGLHLLAANLLTVLACAVVNYAAGDRWVFAPVRG